MKDCALAMLLIFKEWQWWSSSYSNKDNHHQHSSKILHVTTPSVLKFTFVYIWISPWCYCSMLQKTIFHIYTYIHLRLKVCGWCSLRFCRGMSKPQPDTKLFNGQIAAGPESISDGGRIILAKVMETFETTAVSHRNNSTCFAFSACARCMTSASCCS